MFSFCSIQLNDKNPRFIEEKRLISGEGRDRKNPLAALPLSSVAVTYLDRSDYRV